MSYWYILHYFILAFIAFCGLSYYTGIIEKDSVKSESYDYNKDIPIVILVSIFWPIAIIIWSLYWLIAILIVDGIQALYKRLVLAGSK